MAEGPRLDIRLLGQFSVARDGAPVRIASRAAQVLLAYLLLPAGARHRRERLVALLWPDASEENARQNLRNALWTLRKALGESYLLTDKLTVAFDAAAPFDLDAATLDTNEASSTEDLLRAASAYAGELLPGFYDEWILLERERARAAFDRAMALLLERLQAEARPHDVLHWAEHAIAQGQAPEPAYRALMIAHHALGDQAGLASAYRRCVRALQDELGVNPSPETDELYRRCLEEPPAARPASRSERPAHNGAAGGAAPLEARPTRASAADQVRSTHRPVVGREPELDRLSSALAAALAGRGGVTFVRGEAGQGKTRLLEEFSERAQDAHPDLMVVLGHCNAFTGAGDPFLPFRDALEMLTGDVEAKLAAGTIGLRHAERLRRLLPAALRAVSEHGPELLGSFLRTAPLQARAAASDPTGGLESLLERAAAAPEVRNQDRTRLFEAYTRVLHALSSVHPLVLVLEDLHWADPSTLALLFHLARRLAGSRVLLLGSFRAEEAPAGEATDVHVLQRSVAEIERLLGPVLIDLDRSVRGREFVDAVLDVEPNRLGDAFRDRLAASTEGHPLFVVELLEEMKTAGGLQRDEAGRWVENEGFTWYALPARIEGVIRSRIERLDDEVREALSIASVEGEEFTSEAVARVLRRDERVVARALGAEAERRHQLVEGVELKRVDGRRLSRYRFRHSLFQRFLYDSLGRLDRAVLHEEVGTALEELHGAESPRIAVELARHFTEGGLDDRAAKYLSLAGKRASELSAHQEALTHVRRGLELMARRPDSEEVRRQELELRLLLGTSLQALHGFAADEVARAYERARVLALSVGDAERRFTALWSLSLYHTQRADFARARALGEDLLRLSEGEGREDMLLQAHHALWFALFCLGDLNATLDHARKGAALYHPGRETAAPLRPGGHDPGVCGHLFAARALWFLGYPDQAAAASEKALGIAAGLEHPESVAHAFTHAAEVHLLRGEGEPALELAERVGAVARGNELSFWGAWGTILRGAALALLGRSEEAIREMLRGREAYPGIGAVEEVNLRLRLAEAQADLGRLPDAQESLERAFATARETGTPVWTAELHRLRGDLRMKQGGSDPEAIASFRRAIEVAREHGARSLELRAAVSYCRSATGRPEAEEALGLLADAYAWFTEGFDTRDLREARRLLERPAGRVADVR